MNKMEFNSYALCPLDGRYNQVNEQLKEYFSEYALVKYRVFVEISWLKFLLENISNEYLAKFDLSNLASIEAIASEFNQESYKEVKNIEAVTRHDVKAVEMFIANKLEALGYGYLSSFVHIGCTSEDINNTSYALMLKDGVNNVLVTKMQELVNYLNGLATKHQNDAMLAFTHGQAATPTTMGKEFKVYSYRLTNSLKHLKSISLKGKFNGATGNYSAINSCFSNYNWQELSEVFVTKYLNLEFNPITTQIESHDDTCHLLDAIRHFNNVVMDLNLDMWLYISKDYFKQEVVKGEVGSSTMPHKVNPIRFENSEANIEMGNGICVALANKLPRSRMQRDLSDSSSQRNLGLAIGYSLQAVSETLSGLQKCILNTTKLNSDLNEKWEVLAEPIQTMLRKYGDSKAYDTLKQLTRGQNITAEKIQEFVSTIDYLNEEDKNILISLTPSTYIGLANKICDIESK